MFDRDRYSWTSIVNHWVTALAVAIMLALGYAAAAASTERFEDSVMAVHVSLGFFVLVFVVWRVLFRLYEGFPPEKGETAFERRVAHAVPRVLLLLLVTLVATGPLYLFTENECLDVFGWFSVCVPLGSLSIIHEPMEWLHVNIGLYVLPALLVLHLVGALRHYANGEK
jgi:cytochrome b561